jgi:ribosome-associated heat shock protein Hsp15
MRLDLFLKKTCILHQRSVAKEICDAGAVRINGQTAKAAQTVRRDDVVHLRLRNRDLEFRVLEVPAGNVAKRDAERYIHILRDDHLDPHDSVFESD